MKRSEWIFKITFSIACLLWVAGCATENAVVQPSKPIAPAPAPAIKVSTIQKISFIEEENYTRILIEGSESIAPPLVINYYPTP